MLALKLQRGPLNHLKSSKRSVPSRNYGAAGKRVHVETKEFWDASASLVQKRNAESGRLHFVFLEGHSGAGKGELLGRLAKVGYTTRSLPYVKFCSDAWHLSHYAPTTTTVGMFWLAEWIRDLEQLDHAFQNGSHYKDNVIFVQRSPLSLWVHDVSRMQPPSRTNVWLRLMDELKNRFSCSTILCHSEELKLQQRMAARLYWAQGEEKQIREALHEDDEVIQALYHTRYAELEEKGWIDGRVATTSVKQAHAQIIKSYGLDNWEAFKDDINKSNQNL